MLVSNAELLRATRAVVELPANRKLPRWRGAIEAAIEAAAFLAVAVVAVAWLTEL